MNNKIYIISLSIFLTFIYLPTFSQFVGGSYDGSSMLKNADCAPYPAGPNIFLGGSYDGYAMLKNPDCVPYPAGPNIFKGGSYDGYSRIAKSTDPGCLTLLPIELLSFIAEWADKKYATVLLKWTTASEINNDYFAIERSIDAIDFTPVLQVKGAGNSTKTLNYSALDKNPCRTATSYYRLKQVDFDGQYSYSQIKAISPVEGLDIISIYPNPVADEMSFTVTSSINTELEVSVINILGEHVIRQQHHLEKGITTVTINTQGLSSGCYLIRVMTGFGSYTDQKEFVVN